MSQREGTPRSKLSGFFLKLISCITCSEPENEWQAVWQSRDLREPPAGVSPYKPRRIVRGFYDYEIGTTERMKDNS